ncbi:peptidoglycan bridge formation glycyltransferase FemA/FemB family protein [Lactococcus lactis]|uniref:peptidoglycan bridge formation glycyltransferase FemA/FemB family protein n=1 Tax=Lactococcus lactis TaxID=1358 RepID=UPI00288F1824|nr:peptidoglycan bridge formation glycyltransferase FemA/FemB family protein [Lactococcus lactis]MDT2906387.1 peptidoglycan bridge formation glycyltransferase FemA/FemB family protein [Lactococcus lactis]MDT2911047.1 peptidoglycan bridge formation glycyltransferase FemA/FemB family protein [Lactococcus lactis]MDT2932462.1 peptidoglycan bridge formation glycyltransferase FemA/FemB family protein [Lactococcus lactis]MDT2938140.1 peptidoglycan bridge formation glycyltransferase FemA/FemB family pr
MNENTARKFEFKIMTDLEIVENFMIKAPLFDILQTPAWSKVKDEWKSEFLGFVEKENSELVASCLVLTRSLPLGFKMCYIPRGIIMDYSDNELLDFVIQKLKAYGKKEKALFIKFDPLIEDSLEADLLIKKLENLGVVYGGKTKKIHETIQFRFDATISKENYHSDKLSKKLKTRLNKAKKAFPEIKIGQEECTQDFAHLMALTEARKTINLRDKAYFERILTAFPNNSAIVLVYTNVKKLQEEVKDEVIKLSERIKDISNDKKKRLLEKQLLEKKENMNELSEIIKKSGEIVPSAGNLIIYYGEKSYNLYAGMNDNFKKYYVSYLSWDESIKYSFLKGALTHDMGGVEADKGGLRSFKKMFNPSFKEYIGEFDIPTNRAIYPLIKRLYKMRKDKNKKG